MPEPEFEPQSAPESGARPEADEPSGRRRLFEALRKAPGRGQVIVAILLAVVGFAAVTEVRVNNANNSYAGKREEDLIDIFDALTGAADRARGEISRLEETKRKLQGDTSARQAAVDEAEEKLRTLNVLAGRVPIQGPGIRVNVSQGDRPISLTTLLDTVQELRTAQAEGIEFNDKVRVVAQSSFSATDEGIRIDGTLLRAPFTIKAIGDPTVLKNAMDFPDGPREQFEEHDHAEVDVTELEQVEIRSINKGTDPRYANPSGAQ